MRNESYSITPVLPFVETKGSGCGPDKECQRCRSDRAFLRRKRKPSPLTKSRAIRLVDLFAGCGGMSVGLEEAARLAGRSLRIPLAVDSDEHIAKVYKANLPQAKTLVDDVSSLFGGEIGARLTASERYTRESVGPVDILVGGPPCQGHSDLNNHTRRRDPKNALYLLMARAATVLRPTVVVIENVATVGHDSRGVVAATTKALLRSGYQVAEQVLDLQRLGVPQRRRRLILLASRTPGLDPFATLKSLSAGIRCEKARTVEWAIRDLMHTNSTAPYDTPSRYSRENKKRIDFLFDNDRYDLPNRKRPECHRDRDHSYTSVYGRLSWDEPAQTITTGFGSMGQGRYVHPARRSTITPHEAARLQTFPDWFDFGEIHRRGILAKMIGNAVPPLLMARLGAEIIAGLKGAGVGSRRKRA